MNFLQQLQNLFASMRTAEPTPPAPDPDEYCGLSVKATHELMEHLERYGKLRGYHGNGGKMAMVLVTMTPNWRTGLNHDYAKVIHVKAKIYGGDNVYPYQCSIDTSTYPDLDSPLEYTQTFLCIRNQIIKNMENSVLIPADEKTMIAVALHQLVPYWGHE